MLYRVVARAKRILVSVSIYGDRGKWVMDESRAHLPMRLNGLVCIQYLFTTPQC